MTLHSWIAAACLAMALLPAAANAQTPPPYGHWSTDDGSEELFVQQGGTCQFLGHTPQGDSITMGQCSWNSGYAGGILTIMNTNAYRPAPVHFNIVWVDQNTIRVFGDVMHRRPG